MRRFARTGEAAALRSLGDRSGAALALGSISERELHDLVKNRTKPLPREPRATGDPIHVLDRLLVIAEVTEDIQVIGFAGPEQLAPQHAECGHDAVIGRPVHFVVDAGA